MLLLDLDDTIFATKSMDPHLFEPAISVINAYYRSLETASKLELIIHDLWSIPIDKFFEKHETPASIIASFYEQMTRINYSELDIEPFKDYAVVRSLPITKILVTTGLRELQIAKINALGIEADFESIRVDDPRMNPRQSKLKIFSQILEETKLSPNQIWVIGDNPDSEIKAGKQLGMNTIQRKSSSKASSQDANFEISSFQELLGILQ